MGAASAPAQLFPSIPVYPRHSRPPPSFPRKRESTLTPPAAPHYGRAGGGDGGLETEGVAQFG